MKAISAIIVAIALVAFPLATPAAGGKTLQSVKGSVAYQGSSGAPTRLGVGASIGLADNDFAITGKTSLASIVLPDSSKVLIASNSKVQLASFNQASIATAKFVVVNGTLRFKVEHPSGSRANYTFQTTTGQIAVRGTEGDISSGPQGLQVNVYSVSNPNLPVQVTLNSGKVITLNPGQALVVHSVAGATTATVSHLTQQFMHPFTELGAPTNAASLGVTASTAGATSAGAAAGGVTSATIGAAAAVAAAAAAVTVVGKKPASTPATASPSPLPTASPTTAPTATPTVTPTATPTAAPTATPTVTPTATPTVAPTATPTAAPTASPTVAPPSPTPSTTSVPIVIQRPAAAPPRASAPFPIPGAAGGPGGAPPSGIPGKPGCAIPSPACLGGHAPTQPPGGHPPLDPPHVLLQNAETKIGEAE